MAASAYSEVMLPAGAAGVALSWLLVGLVTRYAERTGVVAMPGVRQSHVARTATGGGLGMILALAALSWVAAVLGPAERIWTFVVVPALLLMSAIGWVDDRRTLSPWLRLAVQLAVSFTLIALLARSGWAPGWPLLATAVIALVWVMNMYNFMDGSHGMAGFQGVFAGGVLTWLAASAGQPALALAACLTAAACGGFLPWNFPRPRVFMGDAGSVPLGLALGALLLIALRDAVVSLPVALLVLALFLVDAGWTLFVRVIRGERWYTPHKLHVYQRLIAHGWPHSRVLTLYQAINFGVVAPAIVLANSYPEQAWPIAVSTALILSAGWLLASRRLEVQA